MLPFVSNATTEILRSYLKFKGQNLFIAYNFGGRIWGSNSKFRGKKGTLFLLYLPDRIFSLQCLLTFNNCKSLYKITSKQSLVYDQKFYLGEGLMDKARLTVKEAWVKAKIFCRKKGVQMVSSPMPQPPFYHTIRIFIMPTA